jgi:hypothetical protein
LPGNGKVLSLAEVQVFEKGINRARDRTVSSSSVAYGGVPERAVDGNVDGAYGRGSVTHTEIESNPWWEVDLDQLVEINKISVYNRTDCPACKNIDNVVLTILNEYRKPVYTSRPMKAAKVIEYGGQ